MERVAAIDCGTNSVRLLVAEVANGSSQELTRRMEIVRLGQGVDRTGQLAPAAIARTRAALVDYAGEIQRLEAARVRMVATSATRDAGNAGEFVTMVRDVLGVSPEVVTGDEEARLSFTGAVRGLPADAPPPYLVVDVGGGSTELVTGAETVARAVSVDVGCVRMTERHLGGDPPTRDQVAAAEIDITTAVDGALAEVAPPAGATLVGVAGSITTVAGIALRLPSYQSDRIHHSRIPYDQVAKVTADLLAMTGQQRRALPVMHPGRADVIAAGAMVLRVVMERAGATSVVVSEHDILDGIAWSIAG